MGIQLQGRFNAEGMHTVHINLLFSVNNVAQLMMSERLSHINIPCWTVYNNTTLTRLQNHAGGIICWCMLQMFTGR